jgi:acylphosphatase
VTARRRVRVSGRVQGVFFRASCAREARSLALNGWVRNASDGSVEIVFEGQDAAVEAMTAWCQHGPPAARVEHVDVVDEAPQGLTGFGISG